MAKDCAIVCSKVGQCAGPYRCLSVQVGTTHSTAHTVQEADAGDRRNFFIFLFFYFFF